MALQLFCCEVGVACFQGDVRRSGDGEQDSYACRVATVFNGVNISARYGEGCLIVFSRGVSLGRYFHPFGLDVSYVGDWFYMELAVALFFIMILFQFVFVGYRFLHATLFFGFDYCDYTFRR